MAPVNKAHDVVWKVKSTALQYVRTHTSRSTNWWIGRISGCGWRRV